MPGCDVNEKAFCTAAVGPEPQAPDQPQERPGATDRAEIGFLDGDQMNGRQDLALANVIFSGAGRFRTHNPAVKLRHQSDRLAWTGKDCSKCPVELGITERDIAKDRALMAGSAQCPHRLPYYVEAIR